MKMPSSSSGVRLTGVALCIASTCVSAAGLFDDNEARRQIGIERQRVDELKTQQAQQQAQQQQAVEARLGRIEDSLKTQPVLELFNQIESLKLEINRLRGQIEVLNNSVETAAKRQRDMYQDIDSRLRRIESPGSAVPAAAAPAPGPAAASSSSVPTTASINAPNLAVTPASGVKPPPAVPGAALASLEGGAETRAYEAAQSLRRVGQYQEAIVAFQNFIKQYPKSSLAPRAQYWIGDSYFNLRDYKLAIASQQSLLSGYPESPTVPDALLNIASSQIELGESNAGRKTLEDLVSRYPISDAADKAKRRLAAGPSGKP